jgi:hypothetical protein
MSVSFHLSPEQEQLKLGARQFAEEHLRPLAAGVRKEPDPLRRALLARPTFERAVTRALEGAARCTARTGDQAADLSEAVAIYQRIAAAEAGTATAYLATLEDEVGDAAQQPADS